MAAQIHASMLYDLVTCPHRLTMDRHGPEAEREPETPLQVLLWQRRAANEDELLAAMAERPVEVSGEDAQARELETLAAMDRGEALIAGGRIRCDGLVGEPTLLRLDDGGYVAGDVRCAFATDGPDPSRRPRRSHAMQLAAYTDILECLDRSAGRYGFIVDGRGEEITCELDAPRGPGTHVTLWQDYQRLLARARQQAGDATKTRPARTPACGVCAWRSACMTRLERDDDLSLLPEMGRSTRDAIAAVYPTIRALADADREVLADQARRMEGVGATALVRFHDRACLRRGLDAAPYLRGEVDLPESAVEVFLDVQVSALRDHCFLHGVLERRKGGRARYRAFFARQATEESEEEAFTAAWNHLAALGDAAVYYYSSPVPAAWRTLQERYPQVCDAEEMAELFAADEAVDLYARIVRPRTEWPTGDYSLHSLAAYLGFRWQEEADPGLAPTAWYERWLAEGERAVRDRLLAHGEDDCRAAATVLEAVRHLELREER
jgi:predicted RecB family nuclease